jgi:hypothetical protein
MRTISLLLLSFLTYAAHGQNVIKLSQLIPGVANHQFINPYEFQGKLYFNGGTSDGLYSFDGVNAPTFIADLDPYSIWGYPRDFCQVDSILYISAAGYLWKYDGVNAPTKVWTSHYDQLNPYNLTAYQNKLYFTGNVSGVWNGDFDLLVYDGVNPPTKAYSQSHPVHPSHLTVFNDKLLFIAKKFNGDLELFKYDTINGRQQVSNISFFAPDIYSTFITECNGLLYFNEGTDLYSYHDTNTAPVFVGQHDYPLYGLMCYDNKLFGKGFTSTGFFMYDGDTSTFLANGYTPREADGPGSLQPYHFFEYNDLIYFCGSAPNSVGFFEKDLLVADTIGNVYRHNIMPYMFPYDDDSNPMSFIEFQGRLLFYAIDSADGWEIHTLSCDNYIDTSLTYSTTINRITSPENNTPTSPTTYQWVRCDSGYAPIPGANSRHYSPTANGSYAVIIKKWSCVDTSACFNFNSFDMEESLQTTTAIFPNPTKGEVTIKSSHTIAAIKLYSGIGELLITRQPASSQAELQLPEQAGIYFIQLKYLDGTIQVEKVVKQ